MVPILTMIDIYAAYLHRLELDWTTVWLLLPTSFVGMIIGQLLDKHLTDVGARLLVGVILLCILALRTWKDVVRYLCPKFAIKHQLSGGSKEYKAEVEGKGSMDLNDEEAKELLNEINKEDNSSNHLEIDDGRPSSPTRISRRNNYHQRPSYYGHV